MDGCSRSPTPWSSSTSSWAPSSTSRRRMPCSRICSRFEQPEQIMKNTALCVMLAVGSPAVALAQIGNPAGMAPDTRFDRPGVPAPHQTNTQDRLFAQIASSGGQAEVKFSKLAESKADSAKVKDFARRMINDDAAANNRLKALADASKI